MATSDEFFGERSPQAILKHGLLARYAHYFAGRAGRATAGKVLFLDGYAGEGRYADGSPGSPLLLASQAERAKLFGREVQLVLVEPDDARRRRLARTLEENEIRVGRIIGSPFEVASQSLLDEYPEHAALVFVDPFGLAFSREALERTLRLSSPRRPVDVLYHFSLSTVARMGRAAATDAPGAAQMRQQLDAALGDINWAALFDGAGAPGDATRAAIQLAGEFSASVAATSNGRSTAIPVRQRPNQFPKYMLTLFSRDERAHWDFADVASSAYVDWLHHCDTSDYEANLERERSYGMLSLFEPEAPARASIDEVLAEEAQSYLRDHLLTRLAESPGFRPMDDIAGFYGAMLGRARSKHGRAALKAMHAEGLVTDDASGEYWRRRLYRSH